MSQRTGVSWRVTSQSEEAQLEQTKSGGPKSNGPKSSAPKVAVSADLELAIQKVADRSVARAEDQLEEVMREALSMLRKELCAEIAEGNRILWAQVSELPSRNDMHRFVDCQRALKEQLDLVSKRVSSICVGASTNIKDGTAVDTRSLERSQFEAKFEVLCTEVRALLADVGAETENLQVAKASCEAARYSMNELQQQVALQYEQVNGRISVLEKTKCEQPSSMLDHSSIHQHLPSKEDVLRIVEACRCLRLDDLHAEQQIADLRDSIAKQSQQFESVCQTCDEFHKSYQSRLVACLKVQEELRTEVTALLEERQHQGEAMVLPEMSTMHEVLKASQAEHKKISSIIEALTSSPESLVARI